MRLALFLLAIAATASLATTGADYIRAGRRVSVHAIDSTLAPRRFDDWIRTVAGPGARIAWEANDCGEATGTAADTAYDMPVCVEAEARRPDGRVIHVAIGVGSGHLGIACPPELWWAVIDSAGASRDFRSLGALARALKSLP
jgi:hypothetical protein